MLRLYFPCFFFFFNFSHPSIQLIVVVVVVLFKPTLEIYSNNLVFLSFFLHFEFIKNVDSAMKTNETNYTGILLVANWEYTEHRGRGQIEKKENNISKCLMIDTIFIFNLLMGRTKGTDGLINSIYNFFFMFLFLFVVNPQLK